MIEIRIHGRGGQGNVVAAYLLATAAIADGRHAQAFPAFGAERRGAPVVAFTRIADRTIRRRNEVRTPDFVIVQDDTLLGTGVLNGLKPGGGILVNTTIASDDLSERLGRPALALPATAIAMDTVGRPMPNVPLLSAFLILTGMIGHEALNAALAERFSGRVLEANREAVRRAAGVVPADQWKESDLAASA